MTVLLPREGDTFLAYCDGSSLGNPGPAAWAFSLFRHGEERVDEVVSFPVATNIEMELRAAMALLERLVEADCGAIRTDSEYVVKGCTEWRQGWLRRSWRNAAGKPVAHRELWESVFAEVDRRPGVRLEWVRGHAGDLHNHHVDRLARDAATKVKKGAAR